MEAAPLQISRMEGQSSGSVEEKTPKGIPGPGDSESMPASKKAKTGMEAGTNSNLAAGSADATNCRKRTIWNPKVVEHLRVCQGVSLLRCEEGGLCTRNMIPGKATYNGYITYVQDEDGTVVEYRPWNTFRSPLAAAIARAPEDIFVAPGFRVLYLGDGEGAIATVSHISDIIGTRGVVYEVESCLQNAAKLVNMAARRANVTPILEDARHPENYQAAILRKVDVVYCDMSYISEDEQVAILSKNVSLYLKDGGFFLLTYEAGDRNSSLYERRKRLHTALEAEKLFVIKDICLEPLILNAGLLFGVYRNASLI
ncbi:unnamed protein product [Cuscuta epithymum]|uniref:Fibrillarin n=1 Tax=Cuscuta epithymum TaxID=186058 RepID=A0AAV0EG43_9ASTE|nr:unnamed protein product [Cuscuta epithymum]